MLAKNQWVTIALTLVAVILALRLAFRQRPTSMGLRAKVALNTCDCLGSRLIVFRLLNDGTTFINFEPIGSEGAPELFSRIYSTRADKTIFFLAENNIQFGRVAQAIDLIQSARYGTTDNKIDMTVRLITPQAINTACAAQCYNWGKEGLLLTPRPTLR